MRFLPCGSRSWIWLAALGLGFLLSGFPSEAGAKNKVLKIIPKKEGDIIHFYTENLEATEMTVTFEMKLKNLKPSKTLPYTCTFPAHQVSEAFTLTPIRPGETWDYSYTSRYTIGSCVADHDDSYIYTLPFAATSSFKVSQGYNGSYSHYGPDQYATDFKMPVGTPIHAAREGEVVKVKSDSSIGGSDRKYENDANYILIRHSDGTLANYAHLQKNGSAVKVGQYVLAGDLIGFSGNTGFTSGPHLHFSVFKTKDGSHRQTLPVRFETAKESGITLVQGHTYKSTLERSHNGHHPLPALAGSHKTTATGAPGTRQ